VPSLISDKPRLISKQMYLDSTRTLMGPSHKTLIYRKILKVFTDEKRDGWTVVSFDRSPFKLLTLRISKKSV
jgi:hypothetical protein